MKKRNRGTGDGRVAAVWVHRGVFAHFQAVAARRGTSASALVRAFIGKEVHDDLGRQLEGAQTDAALAR